ncbi:MULTISPECIES: thiosulfohydrolase SoxB [Acidithiobacillus]|jgi:sulfur-oxidizing protein SoxB|uniref:Sulfur oxidation protein SoxB n=3 Tax=Acidithiobacillus caldus TaxID=33059 RepID=F9ZRR8_ACICS|nr:MULTISPECIES: thiosulfohydrolase SoxB [Acidithiobacillus]AEK59018.1 Sulfur oxidation protein SoxB [Acidithiobacillus caldus SM-1]AIA56067.1 Sulfur oxidation protein SoxB [Acidithiobacillus caldus ATCC 51756]AUW33416.1 thiosulfohydrolase SoxB [Acidithiobacillus caldus]MBU2730648.1 thiosulfohydrolase SoxB [Acidithiobacillus caldus]MBU2736240.1 thiosulfohydrolase SoxB [Acidithiobacillus caldus ATCC 51756]
MHLDRRDFLQLLGVAGAASFFAPGAIQAAWGSDKDPYTIPDYGNVTLLHMTDSHAQLLPVWWREPDTNIGVGSVLNQTPHLCGKWMLDYYGVGNDPRYKYAYSCLDYDTLAHKYGKIGGYAHIAALVKRFRQERGDKVLLLDGGDTWQGSATSLWTNAADMVGAQNLLGVDDFVGHWEFTFGQERVEHLVKNELKAAFLAQNVFSNTWQELVFKPYRVHEISGRKIAVIGQAFPFTPIANPAYMIPDWGFGIHTEHMQKMVDEVRQQHQADIVVVLSHNGADVDKKMASMVKGIDIILGGHTHDIMGPKPFVVNQTLIINTSTNGKILARFDLDVGKGKLKGWRFHYLPVFSNLIKADAEMAAYIEKVRAPYKDKLSQPLATTASLLYRRDNFNGTFDQLLCDALREEMDCEASFSPGFRWGYCKLPGETITMEDVMGQTAITYPQATINAYTGEQIKNIMEQVADNIFNPNPYYQQGGDMIRVGNIQYDFNPDEKIYHRISNLRIGGKAVSATKKYKVAGWASMQKVEGKPVWEIFSHWLQSKKHVEVKKLDLPVLNKDMQNNHGIAFPKAYKL